MDRHNTDHPDEGVLCMRNMLRSNGHTVNHKRIRRLMKLMDLPDNDLLDLLLRRRDPQGELATEDVTEVLALLRTPA